MRSAFQIVPLYAFFGFSQPSTAATSALPRRPSRRGSSTRAMAHTPAKLYRMITSVISPVHSPYSGGSANSTKASNTSTAAFASTRAGWTRIPIMRRASTARRVNTSA